MCSKNSALSNQNGALTYCYANADTYYLPIPTITNVVKYLFLLTPVISACSRFNRTTAHLSLKYNFNVYHCTFYGFSFHFKEYACGPFARTKSFALLMEARTGKSQNALWTCHFGISYYQRMESWFMPWIYVKTVKLYAVLFKHRRAV